MVWYSLPQFLLSLLQQTEFAAASFVLGQMLRTFGMYLKSDGFQSVREGIQPPEIML